MTTTASTASQSEFDARVAEFHQTIDGLFDAMRLAASENRQAAYYDLKARCKELRNELHAAQTTGRFADGVSRAPAVETLRLNTGELQVGDIVLNYGMRIRINSIRQLGEPGHIFWACDGTVENLDEVREAQVVPMSWLCTQKFVEGQGWVTDRRDNWNVQGNTLATWTVERRAADRETNSQAIVWQWLTATMSDRAAKQLIATAVAKGEAADRCNHVTYHDGIFSFRTTA